MPRSVSSSHLFGCYRQGPAEGQHTACACRTRARGREEGGSHPRGMHPASERARQQTRDRRHSRSGTSSTQADRGVNDSFRHLHPSGDSTGGKSARMICVVSRSTDKGKRKREKMKRAADPNAETQRVVATRLPSHQKLVCSRRRCGLVRCAPARPKTSFPSPFPSRDVTSCHQWKVGRSTGCHSGWCL